MKMQESLISTEAMRYYAMGQAIAQEGLYAVSSLKIPIMGSQISITSMNLSSWSFR